MVRWVQHDNSQRRVRRNLAAAMEKIEDMLFEVFKHLDSKSLAVAGCVSRRWKRTAEEEALWEGICTNHWPLVYATSAEPEAGQKQLRSVVRALGGFRRLYAHCLRPLLTRQSDSGGGSEREMNRRWSQDQVHLSLSLFSIDCYERLGRRACSSTSLKFLSTSAAQKQYSASFPLHKTPSPLPLPLPAPSLSPPNAL